MSGVRAGRCRGGGEDGEDGREKERRGEGQGRLGKRERVRVWWTLEREEGREEWGISENRGTSLWCRVSRSDFCPFRIRFLLQSGSPKSHRERWVDKERDLCVFLFFFSSGRNKKKSGTTHPICGEQFSFLPLFSN